MNWLHMLKGNLRVESPHLMPHGGRPCARTSRPLRQLSQIVAHPGICCQMIHPTLESCRAELTKSVHRLSFTTLSSRQLPCWGAERGRPEGWMVCHDVLNPEDSNSDPVWGCMNDELLAVNYHIGIDEKCMASVGKTNRGVRCSGTHQIQLVFWQSWSFPYTVLRGKSMPAWSLWQSLTCLFF